MIESKSYKGWDNKEKGEKFHRSCIFKPNCSTLIWNSTKARSASEVQIRHSGGVHESYVTYSLSRRSH